MHTYTSLVLLALVLPSITCYYVPSTLSCLAATHGISVTDSPCKPIATASEYDYTYNGHGNEVVILPRASTRPRSTLHTAPSDGGWTTTRTIHSSTASAVGTMTSSSHTSSSNAQSANQNQTTTSTAFATVSSSSARRASRTSGYILAGGLALVIAGVGIY